MKQDRWKIYKEAGIGLLRSEVKLEKVAARWKRIFSEEAHLIFDSMRFESMRLYHCGSTSILGIAAKPIIDIVGSVSSLAELEANKYRLEEIGYEWKGEYGIPGRRYAVLYDPEKSAAYVHLHFYQQGNAEIDQHLLFRDFLRAHPTAARAYEDEKRKLAKKVPRAEYSEAKSSIISELLEEAFRWKASPLSVLAILGSARGGVNTRSYLLEEFPLAPEVLDLNEVRLSPYLYGPLGEAVDDDFPVIIKKMLAADLVVFATPVYWYAMSGPMKTLFDRFSHLLRGPLKPWGEALYGKKVRLLSTGSDERLPLGYEVPFASTAIYLGMDYLGAHYKRVP